MISVEEAKRIMMEQVPFLATEERALRAVLGSFTATDVISPNDHPLFNMSAVDGYAFAHGPNVDEWSVVAEVAAGEVLDRALMTGECARIFTGAQVPDGADTVVMQEFVDRAGDRIRHTDARLQQGGNVRKQGEQLHKGQVVLPQGLHLNSAAIGLLASVGVVSVKCHPAPKVTLLITGNEFMDPADPKPGMIFGSNDVVLEGMLASADAITEVLNVQDDVQALESAIRQALSTADLLVTTGGASVGDHDLIRPVLESMGAGIHFHGVAQKPGKPMLFAMLNGKPVFGLPGNPRAVMVLFWEYVLPFLRAMQGAKDPWLVTDHLPITHLLEVKGDRAEFRAAQVRSGKVTLLRDEGSHMLRSLVDADALAYLPATQRTWGLGDLVEIHYLPR